MTSSNLSKKIAIVFSGDFPEGNTKNARLKIIATELKLYNWETSFFSTYPYRFSKKLFSKQPKKWNNFPIKFFSITRIYPTFFIFRILQLALAHVVTLLWTLCCAHRYDALYYYNPRWTDTLLSLKINALLGRKCIVDQTELFSTGANPKWHKTEEITIAKSATHLLAISTKIQKHFQTLRKQNTHLFPILINTSRYENERKEQKYLMGYIGSFAAKDGVGLLLEATSQLLKKYPKLMLRLIGHNPEMDKLMEQIKNMGLEQSVEVTGTVTYKEIPWLLNECDTLLMNRDDSVFSSYGYPIKLGEYFACKKPVIMSNGPGFSEDFEHRNQVYKYQVGNAESLAEAIHYRYQNIGESDAVAKRGYDYALDYFDSTKKVAYLAHILNE